MGVDAGILSGKSWTLQPTSGTMSRVTTNVDTAPGALRWTPGTDSTAIDTNYLEETFSGIFRAGIEYTLSVRVTGTGLQAFARFRFGDNVLADITDTGQIVVGSTLSYSTVTMSC